MRLGERERVWWMLGGAVALLVLALALTLYAVVRDVQDVSRLQTWAFWSTLALLFGLPAAALGAYRLGHLSARERIAGLQIGVDQVMSAAQRTAGLRSEARVSTRRAPQPAAFNVFLPGSGSPAIQAPQPYAFGAGDGRGTLIVPRLESGDDVVEL